jgi:Pirin C-terminal cupin domain
VEVRICGGASGSLRSATRNHVPVTVTEITMGPHTSIDQELPTSYNGFAYLINGSVQVGGAVLNRGQVGWLDRPKEARAFCTSLAEKMARPSCCMRVNLRETGSYPTGRSLAIRRRISSGFTPNTVPGNSCGRANSRDRTAEPVFVSGK